MQCEKRNNMTVIAAFVGTLCSCVYWTILPAINNGRYKSIVFVKQTPDSELQIWLDVKHYSCFN